MIDEEKIVIYSIDTFHLGESENSTYGYSPSFI